MDIFVISGGTSLQGEVIVNGAKNVALKTLVASLLTKDDVVIKNVPNIRDVQYMEKVLESLGATVVRHGHTIQVNSATLSSATVPLEIGSHLRTSSMVIGPLLARLGEANIPNPGGCRIGARPIDRHIEGLTAMGATIAYHSDDGFFYAKTSKLTGAHITFSKNTHTGTETLILAAVLADGQTVLKNAAEEIEIDDLIKLLNRMGANVKRTKPREIVIEGVPELHGVEYEIMPDRNEEVTFAVAAAITGGNIIVHNSRRNYLDSFLSMYKKSGGKVEEIDDQTTRYTAGKLVASDIVTAPYPGFMTDWQAPWAVLATQANGDSTIHETVFERRFSYVSELQKMGAQIEFFQPAVVNPQDFYNFNWSDHDSDTPQAIRLHGPTTLHNAVLEIDDLRAGATLVLAALAASGESYIHGIEQIDRGYEKIEERLTNLGADIKRIQE